MSAFASQARELESSLHAWTLQVPALRGVALVDDSGLVLVSTLQARGLEEALAAYAAAALASIRRAERDLGLNTTLCLHQSGRDRQLFLVPVAGETILLAIAEPGAPAPTLELQLLGLAKELGMGGRGG